MRKFKSTFFCLLLLSATLKAQPYIPMLADSMSWYTTYEQFGTYQTDFFYASDDTIIGAETYKVIDKFHFNRRAFLREDTSNQKVYLNLLSGFKAGQDVVIYDFSLSVGDSILMYNSNSIVPDSAWYTLDSTSIETLNNSTSARLFYLSNHSSGQRTEWVEGVGSRSLITTPLELGESSEDISLTCYFKNEDHVYESDLAKTFGYCDIETVGISEDESKNEFKIFPNPVENFLLIAGPENESFSIRIFDLQGRIQLEGKAEGHEMLIGVESLYRACYIVEIRTSTMVHRQLIQKN